MRFDFFKKDLSELSGKVLIIKFINTSESEVKVEFNNDNSLNLQLNSSNHGGINIIKAAYKKILELSVQTSVLGVMPNHPLDFYAVLTYKDNPLVEIERFPVNGYFETIVPDSDFEIVNWLV
jgi:hypothetical protein